AGVVGNREDRSEENCLLVLYDEALTMEEAGEDVSGHAVVEGVFAIRDHGDEDPTACGLPAAILRRRGADEGAREGCPYQFVGPEGDVRSIVAGEAEPLVRRVKDSPFLRDPPWFYRPGKGKPHWQASLSSCGVGGAVICCKVETTTL